MTTDDDDDIIFIKEVKAKQVNHSQELTTNIFDKIARQLQLDFTQFSCQDVATADSDVESEDESDKNNLTDTLKSLSIFKQDDSFLRLKSSQCDSFAEYDSDYKKIYFPQKLPVLQNGIKTPEKSRKRLASCSKGEHRKKSRGDDAKDISSSPIARAFFSPSTKARNDWNSKVGVSVPLSCRISQNKNLTSLEPIIFANSQIDLLDGLAEDDIFQDAYSDSVLLNTSTSVIPPKHIALHLLTVVAFSTKPLTAQKAINTLHNLLYINALSFRNLPITWEFMCCTASKMFIQLKQQIESANQKIQQLAVQDSEQVSTEIPSIFLLMIELMEYDLQRFRNNLRDCILWKLLSPIIYGKSRLKTVFQWLTDCLQIIDDYFDFSNFTYNLSSCPKELIQLTTALQRLLNLVYQSSRDPCGTAETMAELYVNCFFDTRSAESRKRMLSTIEPAVVQRKSAEMILTTICEPGGSSVNYENLTISLDKIVDDYFHRIPPKNQKFNSNHTHESSQEEIEEFLFLLYILCRSYLQEKHLVAVKSLIPVSLPNCEKCSEDSHFPLPFEDRRTFLSIQEDITFLKSRVESYTKCLSIKSLLYWNMIRVLFRFCSVS